MLKKKKERDSHTILEYFLRLIPIPHDKILLQITFPLKKIDRLYPSYSGSRDQEDRGLKPAPGN
jgi:hypothetical protein